MRENYYALAVSIMKNCTPEQAFQLLATGKKKRYREDGVEIVTEMIRLRNQGMTFKAIGERFGMSKDGVYRRIQRAAIKAKAM